MRAWWLCTLRRAHDDTQDNNKPMYMYINSPGGSVTAGFAMFDTMRYVKADVSTINVGLAASMGSLLLAGGAKGKRLALPHSRVMIHQPSMGGIRGQASDIKVEAEMILGIRERVVRTSPSLGPTIGSPHARPSAHHRSISLAHSDPGAVTRARSSPQRYQPESALYTRTPRRPRLPAPRSTTTRS